MAYDANLLRVPDIRWLGVFTSDFEDFCLPDCCLLHLSPEGEQTGVTQMSYLLFNLFMGRCSFTVVCQMPTFEAIFSSAQIGGKLKVFLLGAIYTRKPQNGGKWAETSWSCTSCITSISSMILMWSPVHALDLLLELAFD